MPIGPRYRRVSALQRQFFDREAALTAYDEALRGVRPTSGAQAPDRVTTAGHPAGSGGTS
ncbi:hypothetical protein SNOUR_16775 [Streptomyces noursei ATCC 11455]|nr:hypothetical protein SNOUR_16775 [Streptomyces noursei ATCC 11455]